MREVKPKVHLVARPQLDWVAVKEYLDSVGGTAWLDRVEVDDDGAQSIVEMGGRLCYRSWEPGLNPNVTKIRTDQAEYLGNIIKQLHGSVLEHANFTFILQDVSRVFTHELVRHRVGVAISQESMRYVRLTDIPFWFPEWAQEDPALMDHMKAVLHVLEDFQDWAAEHFKLDDPDTPFFEKKAKTSFMRRLAPDGVATAMQWTANVRTLRWLMQQRTDGGAEEEIRLVFDQVAHIMVRECPALFGDFVRNADGTWVPDYRKV